MNDHTRNSVSLFSTDFLFPYKLKSMTNLLFLFGLEFFSGGSGGSNLELETERNTNINEI